MKNKIGSLFDYQRFENDPRLAALIADTEARYAVTELSDEELLLVSAAGDPYRRPDAESKEVFREDA